MTFGSLCLQESPSWRAWWRIVRSTRRTTACSTIVTSPNCYTTTGLVVKGYCRPLWEEVTIYNNSPNLFVLILSRSHPAILKVPNELFYDEELQACANQMLRESLCSWPHLPKRVMTLHQASASFSKTVWLIGPWFLAHKAEIWKI